MGKYYTADEFAAGTPVPLKDGKLPKILDGRRLVMKLDRTTRIIYPDVTNPSEFEHFYNQYKQGWWLRYEIRAID